MCFIYSINVSAFTVPLLIPVIQIPFDAIAVIRLIDPRIAIEDRF